MFLHPLISEIIAHSLHEKKSRNFALRLHTRRYIKTINSQSIVFASTAIKHTLDSKIAVGKGKRTPFDVNSYKGMHPFSTQRCQLLPITLRAIVRVTEQLSERKPPRLMFSLSGLYLALKAQWQSIPPDSQKAICKIHLMHVWKIVGVVSSDVSAELEWGCDMSTILHVEQQGL